MIFLAIFAVIAAYMLGSINFAVIFTKAFKKGDIRKSGSGNPGATNVMRVGGFLPGLLTFVFDALKGFAACMLGKILFMYVSGSIISLWTMPYSGAYICAVACMLGHVFPLFFGFKGGKGVAISVGIFAVTCPIAIVVGLAVFAILTFITRYVSLGSLVSTIVVIVLATIFRNDSTPAVVQVISCLILAGFIYYKHIGNIKRLIAGRENKI